MDALDAVYLQHIGNDGVFSQEDPTDIRRKLSDKEKKLLQTGLVFYTQFARQNETNLVAMSGTVNAFLQIGELRVQLGEYQEAETAFSEAITRCKKLTVLFPDNAEFLKVLGHAYFEKATLRRSSPQYQNTLADAARALSKAIELQPNFAVAYFRRSEVFQQLVGGQPAAITDLQRAIELDSNRVVYQHKLSLLLCRARRLKFGDLIRALELAKKVVELDPQVAQYHKTLGDMYWDVLKDRELALKELDKAIELDPKLAEAYLSREWVYRSFDPSHASEEINKVLELDPESANAFQTRGDLYLQLGRLEEALADYNEAQRLRKSQRLRPSAHLHKGFGEYYLKLHQFEAARNHFSNAIEAYPSWSILYKRRGLAHFRLEDYDKALADVAKAVELNPKDGSNLWYIPHVGAPAQVIHRSH